MRVLETQLRPGLWVVTLAEKNSCPHTIQSLLPKYEKKDWGLHHKLCCLPRCEVWREVWKGRREAEIHPSTQAAMETTWQWLQHKSTTKWWGVWHHSYCHRLHQQVARMQGPQGQICWWCCRVHDWTCLPWWSCKDPHLWPGERICQPGVCNFLFIHHVHAYFNLSVWLRRMRCSI